jgi:hypothetical protein
MIMSAIETDTDYQIYVDGSIVLWWPISDEAHDWRREHLPEDAMTWGHAIVIEARFWPPIEEGLASDGLVGREHHRGGLVVA